MDLHASRQVGSLNVLGIVWVSTIGIEDFIELGLDTLKRRAVPHEEEESVGHHSRSGVGTGDDSSRSFHQGNGLVWLHGFKTIFIELEKPISN